MGHLQLIKRLPFKKALTSVLAVSFALAIFLILFLIRGINPLVAYYYLFLGAFGNRAAIGSVVSKATTLMFVGVGVAVTFRCKVWNIGPEGQMCLGGLGATVVALTFRDLPAIILIPLLIASAFVFGGFWGTIAGLLKVKLKVDEVFTTLMMNFIAILLIGYLVSGPMQERFVVVPQPQSEIIPFSARLPILLPESTLHSGILISIICAILMHIFLFKSTLGFCIRSIGEGKEASHYAGMNVPKTMVITTFLSAGIIGLAGAAEVSGVQYRLKEGFSGGYGYIGILVSLLGRNHPFGIVLAALFFAILDTGVRSMATALNLPTALSLILEALIILFQVGGDILAERGVM